MTTAPAPGLRALFAGFFSIGIQGFGGVLPWARRMLVERRGWLTGAEFTEILSLGQFLPGPNVVNVSVMVGARFAGVPGVFAALAGLLAAPMAIVIALGFAAARFADAPGVAGALGGLSAAATGLVIANAIKIARPLRGAAPVTLAVLTSALILARVPLLLTMAVMLPLSAVLSARKIR